MASDSKDIVGPAQAKLKLYSNCHSTCSQRVIIVLNIKGLDYEYKAVDILKGDHFDPALEKLLKDVPGKYATGDEVLLADVFLAPQINFSVTWLGIDMTKYPRLAKAHAAYNELPAFQAALPERQPDYPSSS